MESLKEAEEIKTLILRLFRKVRGDLERRLVKSRIQMTPLQYNVLLLAVDRRITIKEIATEMEINPPTLVGVVDYLERKKYLRRSSDPHDRRRTPLEITESGKAVLSKVPSVGEDDALVRGLTRLNATSQTELLKSLTELLNGMKDQ